MQIKSKLNRSFADLTQGKVNLVNLVSQNYDYLPVFAFRLQDERHGGSKVKADC